MRQLGMHAPLDLMLRPWTPTRAEALRRVAAIVPRTGRAYAAQRNFDRGPTDRENVSTLSPYIRHRVVTETELLEAVLSRHSAQAAEKFIQEVFWRTYWKGWLESHPVAWRRYRSTLAERFAELDSAPPLKVAYEDALRGRTGIDAFDAWAAELTSSNYLHNHARMWFASIWIFTLRLPWELGADFFMQNLLDGDPASNTLSWRWVAGLQTRGKTYSATRDNIRRYTGDRFALTTPLARGTQPLADAPIPLGRLPDIPPAVLAEQPTLFVLHDDDLHGDLRDLPPGVRGVCAIGAVSGRSPRPVSSAVLDFYAGVARESVTRTAAATGAIDHGFIDMADASTAANHLRTLAAACGATRIVVPFAPVGLVRDVLDFLRPEIEAGGLAYAELGRRYDAQAWPAATRGFFNLRARIPAIMNALGLQPVDTRDTSMPFELPMERS